MDEGRTTYSDLNKVAANPSSNYFHTESRTVFPFRMGEFERQQIIEFPGNPGQISVIYVAPKANYPLQSVLRQPMRAPRTIEKRVPERNQKTIRRRKNPTHFQHLIQ